MTLERVIIIGGGIAGVSLGCELGLDHDVLLLEAEPALGVHSTGRSAALFMTGYGPPAVRDLTRRSGAEFRRLSGLPGVPDLLTPRGGLYTAWSDSSASALMSLITSQPSMVELAPEQARNWCPVLRTEGMILCAYDTSIRDIDVHALHSHYATTLRRRGGQTVTDARVAEAVRRGAGWEVRAEDGRSWHGDALVNAAGAWGDQVAELCAATGHGLSPRRRTMVVARTAQPVAGDWPVVADVDETWYFKPEGGALLMSPGDESETVPGDARPDPLDVALVLERVNAVTNLRLRSVRTSWAGLRTFAPDRLPVVGPHPGEPALFSFLGQGGYGVQMAPALAKAGAELFRTGTLTDNALAAAMNPGRLQPALDR